jgi:hypothetical protein
VTDEDLASRISIRSDRRHRPSCRGASMSIGPKARKIEALLRGDAGTTVALATAPTT